jgi:hypothetical protein
MGPSHQQDDNLLARTGECLAGLAPVPLVQPDMPDLDWCQETCLNLGPKTGASHARFVSSARFGSSTRFSL